MPEQVIDDTTAEEEVTYCEMCRYGRAYAWPSDTDPHDTEDHPCDVCGVVGHDVEEHRYCHACDEHVSNGHEEVCDGCGYHEDDCECNAEDGEYVHDWDYQPDEILWHGVVDGEHTQRTTRGRSAAHSYRPPPDNQPYLGLEIETESMHCSPRDTAEVWTDAGLGWCKTDGSLSSQGVECVSFPHTYERLEADGTLERTLAAMKAVGARAWEPGHCGLHIHVSRPSFTGKAHQWRFAAAHEAMSKELRWMAGRNGEEDYCKWDGTVHLPIPVAQMSARQLVNYERYGDRPWADTPRKATKVIAGKQENEDRYVSVNVTRGTIELRFWRGSLSPTHVLGAAALADGIQRWARDMSVPTVRRDLPGSQAKAWEAFQGWAIDNLPILQVQRIVKLATKRGVPALPALVSAAGAAEGGEA